ncbi:unnamed protein product [Soboliphyme baturini]|uniref:Reverse transcriptase domain-containing protein n=1 Tax=Soboliphyme baturini TaxID=241478 RepID=A0A183ISN8_9BILA|nr:unnamed protein product [Soboliphyme baturini]
MVRSSQGGECISVGGVETRLLFADDLALLEFSETDLQLSGKIRYSVRRGRHAWDEKPCVSFFPTRFSVRVFGVAVKQVEKFKFLGSCLLLMEKWRRLQEETTGGLEWRVVFCVNYSEPLD